MILESLAAAPALTPHTSAHVNSGDTAWVLVSTALVLFMTPGLALFYGGMVRSKGVLAMLMQNFVCIAVVSIVWVFAGYSLAFGPDAFHGLIGNLHFGALLHMHEQPAGMSLTIPQIAFVYFQMMFAVITTALITGATADRLKFGGWLLFATLWPLLVYAPIAHWVFSPVGWLGKRGVLDFAGGNVVEMNSGAAALAMALVLGVRRGWPKEAMAPHSVPLTLTGAGILWFGWFGFNAGSALAAGQLAAQALGNTQIAACGGLLGWLAVEVARTGKATTLGAATGAVAALVAITPAAGYVDTVPSIAIGLLAGAASAWAVQQKFRWRYDDSLDVFGVHWVGGFVGTLCVGLFATHAVNSVVHHEGLFIGGGGWLLGRQAMAALVSSGWSFCATYVLGRALQATIGLRVAPDDETVGLDSAIHAESAYDFGAWRTGRVGA